MEQIEQINWSVPAIRRLTDQEDELGLPEDYGFELTDIRYQHSGRCFVAEVRTVSQYPGNVSGYEAQIAELSSQLAEQQAALETKPPRPAPSFPAWRPPVRKAWGAMAETILTLPPGRRGFDVHRIERYLSRKESIMELLEKRLTNLLTIKSIVTIALTGVFAWLSVAGKVSTDQFLTVFTVVIGFYFGTQAEKQNSKNGDA